MKQAATRIASVVTCLGCVVIAATGVFRMHAGGGSRHDAVQVVPPPNVSCGCDPHIPCPGTAKTYAPYKQCVGV